MVIVVCWRLCAEKRSFLVVAVVLCVRVVYGGIVCSVWYVSASGAMRLFCGCVFVCFCGVIVMIWGF